MYVVNLFYGIMGKKNVNDYLIFIIYSKCAH